MCSQFDPSNMATPNMQEIDPEAAVKQVSTESSLGRITIPEYSTSGWVLTLKKETAKRHI